MRLVATRDLQAGARLGRDVPGRTPIELPLLRAGTVVTDAYRDALLREGVTAVYVDDALSAGIEVREPVSEATRREATGAVARVLAEPQALASGAGLHDELVGDLEKVASRIVLEVAEWGEAAVALADLAGADGYTFQHSVDVTIVGLAVAHRLFREHGWVDYRGERSYAAIDERLTKLGIGLLLHDVGKLTLPSELLSRPGPLTDEEFEFVKTHAAAGVELLGERVPPTVKAVVRWHHERWDGSGYPDRRVGRGIHQFARIAAVADVFDAVTSERSYAAAATPAVGVELIREGAATSFDPEVVEAFTRVIAPYPAGTEVQLSDGRRALVVSVPPHRADRPVVRVFTDAAGRPVEPFELELARVPRLEIRGPLARRADAA
ncbi:MAG TPA: HD-GYP domain-containing protein [Gaiellaceae bacterium]|jgi:HD-GYP domain-containing protein (c-di-GMP phosphodiesterase class II)